MAKDPCKMAVRNAGFLADAPIVSSHRIVSSACFSLLSGPRIQALANILDRTVSSESESQSNFSMVCREGMSHDSASGPS